MAFPKAWRWLRRWSALYRLGLIAICGVTVVSTLLHAPVLSLAFLAPAFAAFALWGVAGSQLRYFLCPRCGERFIWGLGFFSMSFQSHCAHCGLPKYPEFAEGAQKT